MYGILCQGQIRAQALFLYPNINIVVLKKLISYISKLMRNIESTLELKQRSTIKIVIL